MIEKISFYRRRLKEEYFRYKFNATARKILSTAPVARGQEPFAFLSMVQSRDVTAYLVALKSACLHANPSAVYVVCDPSITSEDRAILTTHVPHIQLLDARQFTHPQIPVGGCWERLHAICQLSRDQYLVQLDADTLTTSAMPEVLAAIRGNEAFLLAENAETKLKQVHMVAAAARVTKVNPNHIQTLSESSMDSIGLPANSVYARGCAAFCGFPPDGDRLSQMLNFSSGMRSHLGDAWNRWGSEQVTSNFLVANSKGVRLLPYPKYGAPETGTKGMEFFHFIGYLRFINDDYRRFSDSVIRKLMH
jgi:hypothetical protein